MASRDTVGAAALLKQPVYYANAELPWESRLASAYDECVGAIRAAMPAGTSVDLSSYALTLDASGSHIDDYADDIQGALQQSIDLPGQAAFTYQGADAQNFYLGKFVLASQGLGAYLTGYARKQIELGALSQEEFDRGAESRLRLFSEIIHLNKMGTLAAAIDPKGYVDKQGAGGGTITLATPGIITQNKSGVAGFGFALPAVIPVGYVIVGIVATLVAAGIGASLVWSSENVKNRKAMIQICDDAMRRGDPQAAVICQDMSAKVLELSDPNKMAGPLDFLVSREMQAKVLPWLALGLGTFLVIQFAPQILQSLSRTGEVWSDHQARALARRRKQAEQEIELPLDDLDDAMEEAYA